MKYTKAIAAIVLASACAGCSTVQGVTNRYAGKIPGGRAALDSFRTAEGASMGMVSTNGKTVQTLAVDRDGHALTNGVFIRLVIDDQIVAPAAADPIVVPLPNTPATTPATNSTAATLGDALDAIGKLPTK